MSKQELTEALAQQDWDNVLKHGSMLCNQSNHQLREAACLAVDTALFLLENSEMSEVSPDLAQIVLSQLP